MWTIPNILTLARIAVLPILLFCIALPGQVFALLAFGLYGLAAFTDYLDGWLARKYGMTSPIGTFLDPIADKIFVICILITLLSLGHLSGFFGIVPVLLIVVREFLVSGLREFLGPLKVKLPVSKLAKYKTAAQMLAIALCLLAPLHLAWQITGTIFLWIAAILTSITGWDYLKASWPHLQTPANPR